MSRTSFGNRQKLLGDVPDFPTRIREKNLRENFAWLNRFLLSLLKQHPGRDSVIMRRRACGWDEVLTGSST
jgi:hypothetical protein